MILVTLCLCGVSSAASLSFPAKHEHFNGNCSGTLVFADDEVRYDGAQHAARWRYQDIQELKLVEGGRVQVLTYKDSLLKLGGDREFNFQASGDLWPVATMLAGKLDRRLVVGFARPAGKMLAQFAVKHLRTVRGDEGTLTFGENEVAYQSNDKSESRTWAYADIESIATSDAFHLSVTTYERQKMHYAARRVFSFQLKEPLREEVYNMLWRRVNSGQGLDLFEKLRSELEQHTNAAIAQRPEKISPQITQITQIGNPFSLSASSADSPSASSADHSSPQVVSMKRILREEGLPESFVGVAKVESGLNPLAISPKNARGLWQFIPETARRYGLRVDGRADERIDAEKSTRAAARYLKDLYAMFGDWKLALAGYNAGEKRVQAARNASGTSSFEALSPRLPRETRNYVPAVLAAFERPLGGVWQPRSVSAVSRGYRVFAPTSLFAWSAGLHARAPVLDAASLSREQ